MKLGNVSIRTLNDGSRRYKASITREGKSIKSTFETEKEARKWLKHVHFGWLDNKIAKNLKINKQKDLSYLDLYIDDIEKISLECRVDALFLEQKELKDKVNRIFNTLIGADSVY